MFVRVVWGALALSLASHEWGHWRGKGWGRGKVSKEALRIRCERQIRGSAGLIVLRTVNQVTLLEVYRRHGVFRQPV